MRGRRVSTVRRSLRRPMEGSRQVKFVIGLGNPGKEHACARYNVGWLALDELACIWQVESERACCDGLLAVKDDVGVFKPLTYMNGSGRAVARLLGQSDAALEETLVLLDDLNLPLGMLRMRGQGSAGGHRGLESVIEWLATDRFPRLRLGIGPLRAGVTSRQFVLSPFDEQELPLVDRMVRRSAMAAQCWVAEGLQTAMSRYNGPLEDPERDTGLPHRAE